MAEPTTLLAVDEGPLPRIPVGDWADSAIDWLKDNLDPVFDAISSGTESAVDGVTDALLVLPPLLFAALLAVLALFVRSVVFAVGSLAGLLLIQSMELWEQAMDTLALVLFATVVSVVIAIPVGIAAAKSSRVSAAVRPVLDLMQTMPAFVYLIPAVTFFSIGLVPGVVTTIIFALPPGVRLTELGIRQVDRETVEAGHAFGSSPWQILRGIELPLARPTIMAGVNQVIMLALSMAVIAGLIGAPGLGQVVVTSISRLNLGLGFEAGLSVVILAIFLDRLTASFGERKGTGGWRSALVRRRTAPAVGTPVAASPDAAEPGRIPAGTGS
ncbi:ABC transporter permease [Candidatus Blastococcus massiliensis]|uniref:ABC transporter permease n=1 Tax=Candidatus Blastococcus massiliensis TaxID=1470358 RepID=UPI0004AE3F83|nr:proline/glycine betaine ABC transporter permease [Candidatus Blastococcus massiliensis]